MQNQEKVIKYLAIICMILLLISTYLLNRKEKECLTLKEEIYINTTNYQTLQKMLYRNMKAVIHSDNISLNQDIVLYKYTKGKKDSVSALNLKNKQILFIPLKSCNVCYDEVYEALLYAQDSLNCNTIIITHKTKYNEVRNMIYDLGFQSDIYFFNNNTFWELVSIKHAPFLGYVDEHLKFCNCFVPLVNYPKFTHLYLQTLSEKYKTYQDKHN